MMPRAGTGGEVAKPRGRERSRGLRIGSMCTGYGGLDLAVIAQQLPTEPHTPRRPMRDTASDETPNFPNNGVVPQQGAAALSLLLGIAARYPVTGQPGSPGTCLSPRAAA